MIHLRIAKATSKCLQCLQLKLPNTPVSYAGFKPIRKEHSLSMSKQFMRGKSFNVQNVIIRLLGKATLLLSRDLYIWADNSNVQIVNFRQVGEQI